MAEKLNLYKGEELIATENKTGDRTTVEITGLESNTDYVEGTY